MQKLRSSCSLAPNLRIEWVHYFRRPEAPRPVVVQLLGTMDDSVTREEYVDIEQFPNTRHLSVPGAGHFDIHRLDLAPDPVLRYALLRDALVGTAWAPAPPPPIL